jgi:YVTN family beta-propeller protein
MKGLKTAVALAFTTAALSVPLGAAAQTPVSVNGDRMLLVTYWGDDKVALIDTQGDKGKEEVWAIDVLKTAGCAKPYDVRVDKRGAHAFVSCSGNNKVASIDIVAQLVEYTITTGSSPRDLQLFNDDSRLIVANSGNDTISVVDVQNRKVLYNVPVPLQPYGVAVTDGGKTALVTGWASGDLHILSLGESSGKVIKKIRVGALPYTVVATQDGKTAYVAANGSHAVIGVDIKQAKVITTTAVGRNPWSIALNPQTNSMLVTNNRSASLSLLKTGESPNVAAVRVASTFSAGSDARFSDAPLARAAKNVAMTSEGRMGAFTDLANNQVVLIDAATGQINKVIDVGKAPYGIEFIRPSH